MGAIEVRFVLAVRVVVVLFTLTFVDRLKTYLCKTSSDAQINLIIRYS